MLWTKKVNLKHTFSTKYISPVQKQKLTKATLIKEEMDKDSKCDLFDAKCYIIIKSDDF